MKVHITHPKSFIIFQLFLKEISKAEIEILRKKKKWWLEKDDRQYYEMSLKVSLPGGSVWAWHTDGTDSHCHTFPLFLNCN